MGKRKVIELSRPRRYMSPDTCCRACGAELQTLKVCKSCGGEKLRGCTRCSTMLDSNNAIMHTRCASA